MTILSRSAGTDRIRAEILFPFVGFAQVQGAGGPQDPVGAGWMPSLAWDLGPGAGAAAGIIGLLPGTVPQTRRDGMPEDGAEKEAAAPSAPPRLLPGAEALGAGRLKQGIAADQLHGLPAHDLPHPRTRQDGHEAADRDWLDEAAQADGFAFLPAEAPGHAGNAGHPALTPVAGDWPDLLILRPQADPAIDFVPDLPVLADHGLPMADHVFF